MSYKGNKLMTDSMSSTTPQRFLWATETMEINPRDQILEIGCGAGLLAEQISMKLVGGHLTAIDKSPSMIKKASKRNESYIAADILNLWAGDFSAFNPASQYDKITAFNVNFFWKNGEKELEIIAKALKDDGILFVFYQMPYKIDQTFSAVMVEKLESFSFSIIEILYANIKPTNVICIKAKRMKSEHPALPS